MSFKNERLMKNNFPEYLSFALMSVVGGVGGTFLQAVIPFIGGLVLLPFLPILGVYNYLIPGNFLDSGEHFSFDFASFFPISVQGWIFIISFFFIVGFIVGILKQITGDRKKLFYSCLIITYILLITLYISIDEKNREREMNKLITPTEVIFKCNELSSLALEQDGTLIKYEKTNTSLRKTIQGTVNLKSKNIIPYRNSKDKYYVEAVKELKNDLSTCRNISGATLADSYVVSGGN